MGIEPTSEAWEASILPLYDARSSLAVDYTQLRDSQYRLATVAHGCPALVCTLLPRRPPLHPCCCPIGTQRSSLFAAA